MTEELKTTGMVIGVVDYKEKDKLVTVFSLQLGVITAVLKSVKSKTAKLRACGQLFCFGEFVLAKNNGRYTITSVDVIDQFYDLTLDYDQFFMASQMIASIPTVLTDVSIADELFLLVIKLLKQLTYQKTDGRLCLIKYMLEVFRMTGNEIVFDFCSNCQKNMTKDVYLDINLGNFVCVRCSTVTSKLLPPKVFETLMIIHQTDLERLSELKMENKLQSLNVLITNFYYRYGKKLTDLIKYLNA